MGGQTGRRGRPRQACPPSPAVLLEVAQAPPLWVAAPPSTAWAAEWRRDWAWPQGAGGSFLCNPRHLAAPFTTRCGPASRWARHLLSGNVASLASGSPVCLPTAPPLAWPPDPAPGRRPHRAGRLTLFPAVFPLLRWPCPPCSRTWPLPQGQLQACPALPGPSAPLGIRADAAPGLAETPPTPSPSARVQATSWGLSVWGTLWVLGGTPVGRAPIDITDMGSCTCAVTSM